MVGGAVAAAAILAIVSVVLVTARDDGTSVVGPDGTVAPNALPALLLPADRISEIMKSPGMTVTEIDEMVSATASPEGCASVWGPVMEGAYRQTQFTGMAAQSVVNEPTHEVIQAVVSFPDAAAAKKSYDKQMFWWEGCKVTVGAKYDDGRSYGADVGVELTKNGVTSMRLTPVRPELPGIWCDRAMTLRHNVIVDVKACSRTVGDAGATIARDIGDKIGPAAPTR